MNRGLALLAALIAAPSAAEVPISIAASGHATVPVEGSFGVRQFVFDTGAEGTAVYADFARSAGMKPAGTERLQGQTGTAETPMISLPRVALDGISKDGLTAIQLDPRADKVPLAGIVGIDLFGDRLVDFDFPTRRLSLAPSGTAVAALKGAPVAATPTVGGLLTVPLRIGATEAVAVIDTGARKTRINWALGRKLGLDPARLAKGDTIQGATNNAVETAMATVHDVRIGNRHIPAAPVLVADLPVFDAFGVADRPAVILGLDWLIATRMVIDFPKRLVWFEASPIGQSK